METGPVNTDTPVTTDGNVNAGLENSNPTTTPTGEGTWDNFIGTDGSFKDGWYQSFNEEFHPSLQKYNTMEGLVSAFGNAQKLIGKKGIIPVDENSSPEQIAEYRKQMNVPDSADKYNYNWEEGTEINTELLSDFNTLAHELNIPEASAQKLVEWHTNNAIQAEQNEVEQIKAYQQQSIQTLKDEFKNDWENVVNNASRVAKAYGSEELLTDEAVANNPHVIKLLNNIATQLGEDPLIQSDTAANVGQTLDDKIQEIMQNPAYANPSDPMYKTLQARIRPLWAKKAELRNG